MNIEKYQHPLKFYLLATLIPWAFWFLAAYMSYITPPTKLINTSVSLLGILGLCAPLGVVLMMSVANHQILNDIKSRLFNFKAIRPRYLWLTCFLMLGSILLAQAISLLFGCSVDQFTFAGESSFAGGALVGGFWLIFAPIVEELAWHTYGTDCLRQRMSLLYTSLLFGVFWALWHFPAFLVKGYYQNNLEAQGIIYSINFMMSVFPFVIIMNWLYYKADRNIVVAIVFHLTGNFFNELFNTDPDSKIIQTILLTVLAVILILSDKKFFLQKAYVRRINKVQKDTHLVATDIISGEPL